MLNDNAVLINYTDREEDIERKIIPFFMKYKKVSRTRSVENTSEESVRNLFSNIKNVKLIKENVRQSKKGNQLNEYEVETFSYEEDHKRFLELYPKAKEALNIYKLNKVEDLYPERYRKNGSFNQKMVKAISDNLIAIDFFEKNIDKEVKGVFNTEDSVHKRAILGRQIVQRRFSIYEEEIKKPLISFIKNLGRKYKIKDLDNYIGNALYALHASERNSDLQAQLT